MSEELKDVAAEESVDDLLLEAEAQLDGAEEAPEEQEKDEYTRTGEYLPKNDEEAKALKSGWSPKHLWRGDPDEWKPAKAFNDIGRLNNRVERQYEKINQLTAQVNSVVEMSRQSQLAFREQTIRELKAQLAAAAEVGDRDTVERVSDEIANQRTQLAHEKAAATVRPQQQDPEFEQFSQSFYQRNAHWIDPKSEGFDLDMFLAAEERFKKLEAICPQVPVEQRLKSIEKYMSEQFGAKGAASHDSTPVRRSSPSVESSDYAARGSSNAAPTKSVSLQGLGLSAKDAQFHRELMSTLQTPELKAQYLKDLKLTLGR